MVLIVAKCNVNKNLVEEVTTNVGVLIVAKCNVNVKGVPIIDGDIKY